MSEPPWKLITVDLDGTLTLGHGWAFIASELGRQKEYQVINEAYLAGNVGESEHLQELLALARGHRVAEIDAILDRAPRVSGIAETVTALHTSGARVALLTHNPEYICAWYARRFSLDGFAGTPIPSPGNDPTEDPGPVRADKLAGLASLLQRWQVPARSAAHVGDGHADASVFPYVGAGIAFNPADESVATAADATVRSDNLESILPVLGRLPPRQPRTPSPAAP
jgi:phosphoserine phosphatase